MRTEKYPGKEKLLKDLFQKSSSLPDEMLKQRILELVTSKQEVFEYEPVISRKAWIVIVLGISAVLISLFLYEYSSSIEISSNLWYQRLTDWSFALQLPELTFSMDLSQIPSSIVMALVAVIICGVYFMISFGRASRLLDSKD